jgi:hypothetical protein
MAAQSLATVGLEMKLPKRGISGPKNLPLGEVQSIPHGGIGKDGAIWKDGIPCKHPGCLSHITHPCEGCGRIGGRYLEYIATNVVYAPKETNFPVQGFTEESPKIDPSVLEFLDQTRKSADAASGADPAVLKKADSDAHAKSIAAHSHVLSSADPTPRVVNTSEEAISEALRMRKQTPANKPAPKEKRKCQFCGGKMERWSATTLRCTACARNEAIMKANQ